MKNNWFGAKCIFFHQGKSNKKINIYEERIFVLEAENFENAINIAESYAEEYASSVTGCNYAKFVECSKLESGNFFSGSKVFSLMRESVLDTDEFISKYYDIDSDYSDKSMDYDHGLSVDLTGIGPFSNKISKYLDYPSNFYDEVDDGSIVIASSVLYGCGKKESELLSDCLNVNIWNFNEHKIDLQQVDLDKLKLSFNKKDVEKFIELQNAGFEFYFMPYSDDRLL